MSTITGVVRNGQVVFDEPAGLPEGTRVEVVPVEAAPTALGMRDEDWPTTPEGVAALLKRWDVHEPLEMSPEEEAAWRADLRARKEREKATFDEWSEKMRRVWE